MALVPTLRRGNAYGITNYMPIWYYRCRYRSKMPFGHEQPDVYLSRSHHFGVTP
jgi:hypothetical protein